MEFLVFGLIIGLLPANIAKNKGKDFLVWWGYGTLFFIVALPHALMMDADTDALELNAIAKGGKKCPHCGEVVKAEAKICRFCQRPIVEGVVKSEALKNNKYKRQPVSRLQFIGMGIIFVSVLGLIAFVGSFLIH